MYKLNVFVGGIYLIHFVRLLLCGLSVILNTPSHFNDAGSVSVYPYNQSKRFEAC